jgi:hypothetical protein
LLFLKAAAVVSREKQKKKIKEDEREEGWKEIMTEKSR